MATYAAAAPTPLVTSTPADAVAAGLERIRSVDPGFDPAQFLEIADTLDAVSRLQTSLADDRRSLLQSGQKRAHAVK